MLTRTVRFQIVAFVTIALLGVTYVAIHYVGLLRYAGASGYVVTLDLAQSGGIFTNAEVTYRGAPVGRVGQLTLTATGVRADLDITTGRKIPSDLDAVVADRSVIGEQYVDLRPQHSGAPYLHSGSHIARSRTTLPPAPQTLLLRGDQFLRSVPVGSLQTVVDEVYSATQGTGQDLQRLLTSSDAFFRTANDNLPATVDLIDTSKSVLATQNTESTAIKTFAANLRLIGGQLRDSDGDLRTVLARTAPATQQVTGLIDQVHGSFHGLLTNLLTTSAVFLRQKDGVREILVRLPVAISIGNSVVTPQGVNVGLVPTFFDPLPCTAGYGGTQVRSGLDTTGNPPLNTAANCAAPPGSAQDLHGTQHAPTPGG